MLANTPQEQPPFWDKRTSIEKNLILAAILATATAVTFLTAIVALLLIRSKPPLRPSIAYVQRTCVDPTDGDDMSICTTPVCVHTASNLLLNIDEKVDPCKDFYEFACGSFLKNTRIPEAGVSVNGFTIIEGKIEEQIRLLLEEPIQPNEARPFVLAKTMYQDCMNVTALEERGTKPLLKLLRRLGGWPVLEADSWDESSFSWEDSLCRLREAGLFFNYFMSFGVFPDRKNSTKRVITLDEGALMVNAAMLKRRSGKDPMKAYYDYMVDIAKVLGANESRAKVELKQSLRFEIDLAKLKIPREKKRNDARLYNPMTIRQLTKEFPSISWLKFINRLLAPYVTVDAEEVTVVEVPGYIGGLENLLKVSPKRVQANYLMWRVTDGLVARLNEAMRQPELTFIKITNGITERESRWKKCSNDIGYRLMPIAVGALYIRKYFSEKSKDNALELVNDIRHQFRKTLTKVCWMDNRTRSAALDKADSMVSHIAYPQELLDENKITEYYSTLMWKPGHYMESFLRINLFMMGKIFSKFKKPVNKTDWINHADPAVANAFYSHSENSIRFPAGILQGRFFSGERPAYLNYGAIGCIIGHEITHGFDDQGRQYDMSGNLVDWWQEDSKHKYLKNAQCIIEQYSNYTATEVGLKLNGKLTQGENIADNGGVKEAYYAYKAWAKRHGVESRLPGLEKYTPKQMFWISAANNWCTISRNETLKSQVRNSHHSPARFRVIGPLSNLKEFAKDFKCPTGSQMNPQNKCKVW